jgi:hypothetical protein
MENGCWRIETRKMSKFKAQMSNEIQMPKGKIQMSKFKRENPKFKGQNPNDKELVGLV